MNWALLAIALASGPSRESAVRFMTTPALKSCTIWNGTAKLGTCKTFMALLPGHYDLEIRSDELARPHKFSIEFGPAKKIEVTEDISSDLPPTK
jgi:hypothetical protein